MLSDSLPGLSDTARHLAIGQTRKIHPTLKMDTMFDGNPARLSDVTAYAGSNSCYLESRVRPQACQPPRRQVNLSLDQVTVWPNCSDDLGNNLSHCLEP